MVRKEKLEKFTRKPKSFSLDYLVKQISPENRHKVVDFGEPRGKEVW
jgi:antitoxin component of MazEF toxin-antitoxin module